MPQRGATRLYGPRHSAPWPRDRPSGRKGLAQGAHHGVSRERRRAREWRNDPEKPLAERFRKLTSVPSSASFTRAGPPRKLNASRPYLMLEPDDRQLMEEAENRYSAMFFASKCGKRVAQGNH